MSSTEKDEIEYKETLRRLSVDHNHETGKIRGLLCSKCNFVLGHCDDSIYILEKSISYLKDNN